jgi:hypothetical protein
VQGEITGEVGGILLVALEGVEVCDDGGARETGGGAGHSVEDIAAGLYGLEVAARDGEVEWSVGLGEFGEECGVAVDVVGLGFDVGAEMLPVGVRGVGGREEEHGQEKRDAAHAVEYSVRGVVGFVGWGDCVG